MMKKMIGTGAVISTAIFLILSFLIYVNGEFFSAIYLQLALLFFVMAFVLSTLFLVKNYTQIPRKTDVLLGGGFGTLLILYAVLIAFNIFDITAHFNWLIVFGLIFLSLMQTALLRQRKPNFSLVKAIFTQIALVSNLFLIVFFIGQWGYTDLSIWVNTAIGISFVAFTIAFLMPSKVPTTQP